MKNNILKMRLESLSDRELFLNYRHKEKFYHLLHKQGIDMEDGQLTSIHLHLKKNHYMISL
ncbi:hypothetical protein [Tissierella carlieri]|uniref:Uncharacterized protein n=1 Tax=Tissierella carlieri TaxID=689904 RepID=A0ABT1S6L2_9FIRM|nr:hypothetical protein [Tissierella carlieri]MCQ4922096.1 hypothetical protein [Tissierella carlieri]